MLISSVVIEVHCLQEDIKNLMENDYITKYDILVHICDLQITYGVSMELEYLHLYKKKV